MPQIIIEINEEEAERFLDTIASLRGYNVESGVSKADFIGAQLAASLSSEVLQHEINVAVEKVRQEQDQKTIEINVKTDGFKG